VRNSALDLANDKVKVSCNLLVFEASFVKCLSLQTLVLGGFCCAQFPNGGEGGATACALCSIEEPEGAGVGGLDLNETDGVDILITGLQIV
jgi:hypothetical protein